MRAVTELRTASIRCIAHTPDTLSALTQRYRLLHAGLLFFTTYTLLVLFWAEIYHQARSMPTGSLRPIFAGINIVVYAVLVRFMGGRQFCRLLAHLGSSLFKNGRIAAVKKHAGPCLLIMLTCGQIHVAGCTLDMEHHGDRSSHGNPGLPAVRRVCSSSVCVCSHRLHSVWRQAVPDASALPDRVPWASQEAARGRACHVHLRGLLHHQVWPGCARSACASWHDAASAEA